MRDRPARRAPHTSRSLGGTLMNLPYRIGTSAAWLGGGIALVAASYAAYVGLAWLRFGRPARPAGPEDADALLDHFMPEYEVSERHHVGVAAPAAVTVARAGDLDL